MPPLFKRRRLVPCFATGNNGMPNAAPRLRRRLYYWLEDRPHGFGRVIQAFIFALILINVLAVTLETVKPLAERNHALFHWIEMISLAVFTFEYGLRLYCCVEDRLDRYRDPVLGRVRFALTPMALIDLVAIVPAFFLLVGVDLGDLRLARILRVFKLARYSPAMAMLGRVLYAERRNLGGAVIILLVLLVLSSAGVYYLEREAQPDKFGSIPETMWWAMAALTTVGYGDVTPVTPLGRVLGGFVTLLGMGMFALPTGILASGFVEEAKRRDFVVTWNLVAGVPFFASLLAPRIAEIVSALKPRIAEPGEVIVREGDDAYSMFIIAAGEAAVEFAGGREAARLNPGDFFGEIALLERTTRTATVRAVTECRLLELSTAEFHALIELHADLGAAVARIAAQRKAANTANAAPPVSS
jgi:voltage-gated potassium channel